MKLEQLHIDGFGTLSNFDYTFNEGLNTLCHENGWGKTTLGVFIKVMFYGFSNEKARIKKNRERNQYKPWNNSSYGGWITFQIDGKTYYLRRKFGDEPKSDVFELRDAVTRIVSNDYNSIDIGETIFGINSECFARTMFISQREYEKGNNDSINSKLGNLVDDTDDINNYESARERLETILRSLKGGRGGGSIEKNAEMIRRLSSEVGALETVEAQLQTYDNDIYKCELELERKRADRKEKDDQRNKLSYELGLKAAKVEYDRLTEAVSESRKKYQQLSAAFPGAVPDLSEIEEYLESAKGFRTIKANIDSSRFSDSEADRYEKLYIRYGKIDPDVLDRAEMENRIKALARQREKVEGLDLSADEYSFVDENRDLLGTFDPERHGTIISLWKKEKDELSKRILQRQLSDYDKDDLHRLEIRFSDNDAGFDRDKIQSLMDLWPNAQSEENAIRGLEQNISSEHIFITRKKGATTLWLIVSLLLAAGGLTTYYTGTGSFYLWTGLGGTGIALGIIALIVRLISNRNSRKTIDDLESEILGKRTYVDGVYQSAAAILGNYGMDFDPFKATSDLSSILSQYDQYTALKKKVQEYDRDNSIDNRRIEEIKHETFGYLKRYGYTPDDDSALSDLIKLEDRYKRYTELCQKRDSTELADLKHIYSEESDSIASVLSGICGYAVNENDYQNVLYKICSDLDDYQALSEKKRVFEAAQNDYRQTEDEIISFLRKCSITPSANLENQLTKLREDKILLDEAYKSLEDDKEKKNAYETDHPDYIKLSSFVMSDEGTDINSLNTLIDEMDTDISRTQKKLDEMKAEQTKQNDRYIDLLDMRGELERLENENASLKEQYDIVDHANMFLRKAKESFNAKYGGPVDKALRHYFGLLGKGADFTIETDANKELIIHAAGEEQTKDVLSKGYSDIVDLCLSLSLVDAMYPEESPIVILDDPFINLDKEKIEIGLSLLKEISEKYQMLYLTCHESRIN